jgi:cytochrome b involved in lipid metabolism
MGKKIFILAIIIYVLVAGGLFAAGYLWPQNNNKMGNSNNPSVTGSTENKDTNSNATTTTQTQINVAAGTPTGNANSGTVKYDIAMVGRHNSNQDCWLIIHGNIYNVTTFINVHPGGVRAIANFCGNDATAAFDGLPHSAFANNLLKNFAIARVNEVAAPSAISDLPKQLPTSTLQNLKRGDDDEREGGEDEDGVEWKL